MLDMMISMMMSITDKLYVEFFPINENYFTKNKFNVYIHYVYIYINLLFLFLII